MSDSHLPEGAATAIDRGLKGAEAAELRKDEDYVGLPLGEPFAPAVPGLAIGLFRTAGRRPGGPNLVYPAKIVIRIALLSTEMRFDQPIDDTRVRAEGPEGSLGSLADLAGLSIADRQQLRARYIAALHSAAVAVAGARASDYALQEDIRSVFERLCEKALASSYSVIAPTFIAWLHSR